MSRLLERALRVAGGVMLGLLASLPALGSDSGAPGDVARLGTADLR